MLGGLAITTVRLRLLVCAHVRSFLVMGGSIPVTEGVSGMWCHFWSRWLTSGRTDTERIFSCIRFFFLICKLHFFPLYSNIVYFLYPHSNICFFICQHYKQDTKIRLENNKLPFCKIIFLFYLFYKCSFSH